LKKCMQTCLLLLFCVIAMTGHVNASAGSVTSYEKITWGISTGRYYVNGIHAFCAEYSKSWPTVGTDIISIEPCPNEVLRKALYYGYNGPANTLGNDERAHVLTAIAVSDANIGERETGASSKYDVFYWDIVNNPSKYPSPPNQFKAYLAKPSNNLMQTLSFYIMEENGYVKGQKRSSNTSLTQDNSCYSLENAEYGIYSDASLDEVYRVETFITDRDGNTNTVELPPGKYFACERKAPEGYQKSEEVISFEVVSKQTITLAFEDDPQIHNIGLLVKKVDADTGLSEPYGNASLQGAQFTVKFYKGSQEIADRNADYVWVFETDEKGEIYMEPEYLVSGDPLPAGLPHGTLTIQETKASQGYLINPTVYKNQLWVETFQYPIVKEERIPPYKLVIHKSDSYKNVLAGAEFTLYADAECKNEVAKGVTDHEGKLLFQNMEVNKTYYLKETKTPEGYRSSEEKIWEVFTNVSPTDNEMHLEVENDPEIILPKTGSCSVVLIPMIGILACFISILLTQKEKEKRI